MNYNIAKESKERSLGVAVAKQTVAALVAAVAAVALPQVVHSIGLMTGSGSALGEMLLPMHLPILMVGFLAGPIAGVLAGAVSPLISFLLTGMPSAAMLPFLVIELAVYGFGAGRMRGVSMPKFGKVFLVQVAGRGIRALAILLSVVVFHSTAISTGIIFSSVVKGVPGIVLQWILIPLMLYFVERNQKNV